jgi:hypothetical protein
MLPARTLLLAAALLLQPCSGFAADQVFSGSLQRVGRESMTVRLNDGTLVDAVLPNRSGLTAETLASRYNLGDQIQITCQQIRPVWEEAATRSQDLELTKLRLLRPASPEELSKVLATRPWRGEPNLLARPASAVAADLRRGMPPAAPDARLDHVREVNLSYVSNMPNFVADETAKRYTKRGASGQWTYFDTVETEIAFQGSRAVRRNIRKDGRPWDGPFQELPGYLWYGGFGTEIEPVFDPLCPTAIEYEGPAEVRGKPLVAYRFDSPPDGCFVRFTFLHQRYNPARSGRVLVDDPGCNIVQLEEHASGFPAEFNLVQRTEQVSWDYVKIGDASHLLPVGADFVAQYSSGEWWHLDVRYANHRHFESSTNITFH